MWKRDKWEYVSFSKKTAKRNPKMIIREYEHLIEILEEKVKELNIRKYNIRVTSVEFAGLTSVEFAGLTSEISGNFDMVINFSQLEMLYKRAVKKEEYTISTLKNLQDVKAELKRFKQIYYY